MEENKEIKENKETVEKIQDASSYIKNEEVQQPSLSFKEIKALRKAKYDKIYTNFKEAYILQNKRTKMVVEIRAASSLHACHIIGWRPRHTRVLGIIDTTVTTDINEVLATPEPISVEPTVS